MICHICESVIRQTFPDTSDSGLNFTCNVCLEIQMMLSVYWVDALPKAWSDSKKCSALAQLAFRAAALATGGKLKM